MKTRLAFAALALVAGIARADGINIDINTPPTIIIKHSMEQRTSRLVRFYDAGIIGLAKNGDIAVRDSSHLTLMQRQIAEKLVDGEVNDRSALIAAIAYSNGKHEDSLPEVRAALVKQWREHWKSGWYMQDDQGNWAKKP